MLGFQETYPLPCHFEASDNRRVSDAEKSARGPAVTFPDMEVCEDFPIADPCVKTTFSRKDDSESGVHPCEGVQSLRAEQSVEKTARHVTGGRSSINGSAYT